EGGYERGIGDRTHAGGQIPLISGRHDRHPGAASEVELDAGPLPCAREGGNDRCPFVRVEEENAGLTRRSRRGDKLISCAEAPHPSAYRVLPSFGESDPAIGHKIVEVLHHHRLSKNG